MTGLAPYLLLDGTTRAALTFYGETFGGTPELHTFAEFERTDGPPEAIAHGQLVTPDVTLYAADAGRGNDPFVPRGIMLSLLGTAAPATLREWFEQLSVGGTVLEPLERRAWDAVDGQVLDRFGVHWLIGFQRASGD